ncbi:hypothetical protein CsSME_00046796 [Camellia sinensis var. sinensis]
MKMNPTLNRLNARSFPSSDALRLPPDVSKNEQGAPHRRLGAVKNGQRFPHFSGRAQVKKLTFIWCLSTLRRHMTETKTEYMECKFSNSNNESRGEVKIENQELPKSEHFRYLGSIITTAGEIDADVAWTEAPSVPSALVAMLLRLPNVKFVIVTLGEDGCIMLQRSVTEGDQPEEMDIDSLLESLKQRNDSNTVIPTCVSSVVTKLRARGMGTVSGRLFVGTAEKIPSSELVDTTGAGDAFIGAVLYAICASMQPEKMLLFAAQVAAAGCRALGARAGLPYLTDPRLAPFL